MENNETLTIEEKIKNIVEEFNSPKALSYRNFSSYKIKNFLFKKHCNHKMIKLIPYRVYHKCENKLERHKEIKHIVICTCPYCSYIEIRNYWEFGGLLE